MFCYVAPWSGGLLFTGDLRMTDIITTDAEKLLQALDSPEEQPCNTTVHLPHLLGPLHNLNARTLQTVVTAITKDLCVDWSGEIPTWWSEDIPFCKPCTISPSHKGTLLDEVEHEFHVCTNRNSLCIYVCMYIMHLLHLSTYFHAGHWCDALRRVTDMLV